MKAEILLFLSIYVTIPALPSWVVDLAVCLTLHAQLMK